ncbi:MAG: hypothetical protein G01um10147_485 [Microgenomates group bacterium Gr01-1014_7]|nr:MAG: hypothetical protein G01um10147_485 [Microgenomates group bacterium Gr01-1014_7]
MTEQVELSYFAAHPVICHMEATRLQGVVAYETIKNRGMRGLKQYGLYFGGMLAYGIREPARAALIRSAYAWFRDGDDKVDGDKLLPPGYKDKGEFLQIKRELIHKASKPDGQPVFGERTDILLIDYFVLARRLKIDLTEESLAVWDTIELDEERARNRRVLTQEELDGYFEKLDLACGEGALKVAGETCDSHDSLSLSWPVRTMFNLRDFPRDFAQGIINVSQEDLVVYGIDLSRLEGRKTVEQVMGYAPMRRWYRDQTVTGITFLQEAKERLKVLHLRRPTRFALNRFFVGPTEKTLNKYAKMLAN